MLSDCNLYNLLCFDKLSIEIQTPSLIPIYTFVREQVPNRGLLKFNEMHGFNRVRIKRNYTFLRLYQAFNDKQNEGQYIEYNAIFS